MTSGRASLQTKVLDHGPGWVKSAMILAGGFYFRWTRFGRAYRACRSELRRLDRLGPDAALEWQRERLRAVLSTAMRDVPFYQDRFSAHGMLTGNPFEILRQLPVVSREDFVRNADRMMRKAVRSEVAWHKTSGTTGQPLRFAIPKTLRWARNFAHVYAWYEKFGFSQGDRRATLGGRYLGAAPEGEVYRNPFENQLLLGVHTLGARSVARYLDALRYFSPKMLQGHPSAIAKLVSLGRAANLEFPRVPLVFTTGETLFENDRGAIESAFGAKVVSMYGHGEMCFMACECGIGAGFHVDPFLGHVELLPHPSGMKEVVVTSFHNDVMPFLRYRTGDLVGGWVEGACGCGLWYPRLDAVHGRIDDAILALDGSRIAPVEIRTAVSSYVVDAPAFSVTQHREFGRYTLTIYAAQLVAEVKAYEIAGRLRAITGRESRVSIVFLSEEELHRKAGKHKMVVSEGPWIGNEKVPG